MLNRFPWGRGDIYDAYEEVHSLSDLIIDRVARSDFEDDWDIYPRTATRLMAGEASNQSYTSDNNDSEDELEDGGANSDSEDESTDGGNIDSEGETSEDSD